MNKRMWSLTRASFLELIRDPMVTGLAMLFPLAFIGMYLILPDLRITPQLTISALAFGLPSIILLAHWRSVLPVRLRRWCSTGETVRCETSE